MASNRNDVHPPWQRIGQDPSEFFGEECIPVGFVLQDPSRMGKSVKYLIEHLRERQEKYGVNGFHFKFTLNGNVMQPATYPDAAAEVIATGVDVV